MRLNPRIWPWVIMATTIVIGAIGVFVSAAVMMPNKWDDARALGVCNGIPIVQRKDGSTWLRVGWRAYRIDDVNKLSC
jgi:hypothetical protein